ncbi:MAG: hypothetical protein JXR63_07955 [Spirochaetales bacterium]|nr:hypothetical protein [Spirochaetales bacterium]
MGDVSELLRLALLILLAVAGMYVQFRLVSKTGYSGWLFILLLIPIINIIFILVLAFAKWPIEEKLEKYKKVIDKHNLWQEVADLEPQDYEQEWDLGPDSKLVCIRCGHTIDSPDDICSHCGYNERSVF